MWRFPKITLLLLTAFFVLAGWLGAVSWDEYHFRAAVRAYREDRLPDVHRHLARCLRIWPNHFKAHLLAARAYRMENKYAEAEYHLDECKRIKGTTDKMQTEWVLLNAQSGLRSLEGSLARCVRENHPDSLAMLETLARCQMRDLHLHTARLYLDEWLKRDPDNIRALNWRSWVNERLENPEAAQEDCLRLLQLRPDHAEIRLRLVGYLIAGRRVLEAEQHFAVLIKERGDDPQVMLNWALFQMLKGKHGEARMTLEELLEKSPDDSQLLYELGQIELQEGNRDEAEKRFRKACQSNPSHVSSLYSLYYVLQQDPQRKKEAQEAHAKFKKAKEDVKLFKKLMEDIEKAPTNDRLQLEAGELFLLMGNRKMAEQFFLRAQTFNRANVRALEHLIEFYERDTDEKNKTKAADFQKILGQLRPETKKANTSK